MKRSFILFYVPAFLGFTLIIASTHAFAETLVDHGCHGNALEACYLVIDGPITSEVADKVGAMLDEGIETFKVLLNSSGGDLNAGMALGRAIRKHALETSIGVYQQYDLPSPGACLSACAYAYLGGTQRIMNEDNQLGFHRFVLGSNQQIEGVGGVLVGQKLAASVIAYMVEMGVDARLFSVASETAFTEMYFPDRAARIEYDVETAYGFGRFFMEPYGNGVVAVSKRLGPTHAYDRVGQLTAYCRNGRPHVLLSVLGENAYVPRVSNANFEISITLEDSPENDQWTKVKPSERDVRTWSGPTGGHIELAFDGWALPISNAVKSFRASFSVSRAAGGLYRARVDLNEMDREMLRSAFRFCI